MNGKHFAPDWDHWRRMDEWTIGEATCLLLEVDPDSARGRSITEMRRLSQTMSTSCDRETWTRAKKISDLVWASHSKGKLRTIRVMYPEGGSPPALAPSEWLAWARGKNLAIPKELDGITSATTSAPLVEKTFQTKERETLLKLVVGLAIKGFDYQPKAGRSNTVKEIAAALEGLGIGMDEDTIRNKLQEAAKLLPR
jgi:hypothetical protein